MVLQLILILGIIIVGLYVFGVGTDFIDDIITSFDERIAKQGETTDPTFQERVNLAKDTNTRVCDLQITFHASAYGGNQLTPDPFEAIFSDTINIYHGDIVAFGDPFFRPLAGNPNIFEYQWFCTGGTSSGPVTTESGTKTIIGKTLFGETFEISVPEDSISTGGDEVCVARGEEIICSQLSFLGLLSWNLGNNLRDGGEQLSVLNPETDRETIRINFFGKSLTSGKDLGSALQEDKGTDANPFTKSIMLPRGVDFPVDYAIVFLLKDVTEDNYVITFWDNELPQNGESPGHRFSPKDVCKPGLQRC